MAACLGLACAGGGPPQRSPVERGALLCEFPREPEPPGVEGGPLLELCRDLLGPLARDEADAWFERLSPRIAVAPEFVLLGERGDSERLDRLRAAVEAAGGPRSFLGVSGPGPVVVRVERDCRACRTRFVVFRVGGARGGRGPASLANHPTRAGTRWALMAQKLCTAPSHKKLRPTVISVLVPASPTSEVRYRKREKEEEQDEETAKPRGLPGEDVRSSGAGESLEEVLQARLARLPPPIQMSEALAHNYPAELKTIVANCLSHGRWHFVDIVESFPDEGRKVLEPLAEVYRHDASARAQRLTASQRLAHHQEHSGPLMKELEAWMRAQLDEHRVEPNSPLGEALRYMLKHWPALTLFLRMAGAPLDNNVCERALKKAILHRKNSRHPDEVGRDPDAWLPWNYTAHACRRRAPEFPGEPKDPPARRDRVGVTRAPLRDDARAATILLA